MLTARQYDIAVKAGSTTLQTKEIAQHFNISPRTVKWHLDRVYARLGIQHTRVALAIFYAKHQFNFRDWPAYVRWANRH